MTVVNLDHISSNPTLPEVQKAMIKAIQANYGNPSSQHKLGDVSAGVLENARESVATLIHANNPREVVFTSGGTESVNHAIKGIALAHRDKGKHIITSNIEHKSVIRSLRALRMLGFQITSLPVDHYGRVDPENVVKAIKKDTILISIIHGNNEIGTIQPIEEIAQIAREKKIFCHVDAVDTVGVVPVDAQKLGVNLLSFASNPYYGPTGIGGLYVKSGTKIQPLLDGGTQENNKRAGTENLIGIVGMGVAADLAHRHMASRLDKLRTLREKLLKELPNYIDEYIINGHPQHVLPNLISVAFKYIEGESVVLMLDDENIAASTRSACASGSLRASHVLLSIGLEFADAQGTLVITLGIDNTEEDLMTFLKALKRTVTTLRNMSPLYQKALQGH